MLVHVNMKKLKKTIIENKNSNSGKSVTKYRLNKYKLNVCLKVFMIRVTFWFNKT